MRILRKVLKIRIDMDLFAFDKSHAFTNHITSETKATQHDNKKIIPTVHYHKFTCKFYELDTLRAS